MKIIALSLKYFEIMLIFFWKLENIRYGDWGAGFNGDGPLSIQANSSLVRFIYAFILNLLSSHFLTAAGNIRSLMAKNFFL